MYKCCNCGYVFDEDEISEWKEDGEPFSACPVCKGNYDEAYQCDGCREWYRANELHEGLCIDCLHGAEFSEVEKIGEDFPEEVKISSFWAYCFSEKEINEILNFAFFRRKGFSKKEARGYIDEDPEFFAYALKLLRQREAKSETLSETKRATLVSKGKKKVKT